jgi:hypothetical protein
MPVRRGTRVGGKGTKKKEDSLFNIYSRESFEEMRRYMDQVVKQQVAEVLAKEKVKAKKKDEPPSDDGDGNDNDDNFSSVSEDSSRSKHEPRHWEERMRTDIPEFHGGIQPEEFLDWVGAVEEVFDFKEVPEKKRVPLVAKRLRGHASA